VGRPLVGAVSFRSAAGRCEPAMSAARPNCISARRSPLGQCAAGAPQAAMPPRHADISVAGATDRGAH
jgi:hypothetical protein